MPLPELDVLDPGQIENPYELYRRLREQAPVYQVPGTQVYLVSSWELVEEVIRNKGDFSANLTGILITGETGLPELFDFEVFGGTVDAIANADEPVHSVHRKLVLPHLNANSVRAMEPEVRQWTRERLRGLLDKGGGDWVKEMADPVPVLAMARLIGLPLSDLDRHLKWAFSGGAILAGTTTLETMAELASDTAELSQYLHDAVAAALDADMSGKPKNILDELARGVHAASITAQDAVSILIVLVGAAGESTSSLTGSAVRLLAQNLQLQETLRASPQLIPAFIEEVLRLESPFRGHYRVVRNSIQLGDVQLPENARIMLLWSAANRDPAMVENPDELLLDRRRPRDHLAFGLGMHFCVGARLARMEVRIVLEELLSATSEFALQPAVELRHLPSIFVRRLEHLPISLQRSGG